MAWLKFDCPRCQTALQVPDSLSGRAMTCPACEAKIPVPQLAAMPAGGAPMATAPMATPASSAAPTAQPISSAPGAAPMARPVGPTAAAPRALPPSGYPPAAPPLTMPRSPATRGTTPGSSQVVNSPPPPSVLAPMKANAAPATPPRSAAGSQLIPPAAMPPAPLPPAGQVSPAVARPPVANPASAPPPALKVARFITAESAQSTMQLPADGQLPTLHLSETSTADKGAVKGRGMHPLALAGLVALSFCASVGLLMLDSDGRGGVVRQGDYLRNQIAGYYTDKAEPLEPYQADLREAQQAYSRGDLKTEQAYYRRVLDLLRAEGRSRFRGLTGTPDSDRKLEKLLADLLALERAASPDDSG